MSQVPSKKYCNNHFSWMGCAQRCRSTEVWRSASFKQLSTGTFATTSCEVPWVVPRILWGAGKASRVQPVSKSRLGQRSSGQKCVALGTDDSLQMQKCLLDEWGMDGKNEGQMVSQRRNRAQCQLMTFSIQRRLLRWLFPGFPFSLRWQIFSAAMAFQRRSHQKSQRPSQCWQFQPMAMFVYLFFGTNKKRTRNKNVTIDLRLLSSKILKDDNYIIRNCRLAKIFERHDVLTQRRRAMLSLLF